MKAVIKFISLLLLINLTGCTHIQKTEDVQVPVYDNAGHYVGSKTQTYVHDYFKPNFY